MNQTNNGFKFLLFQSFLLIILLKFSLSLISTKSKNIFISKIDLFPHNIDNEFKLTVTHPSIEYHYLYAMFILKVNCVAKSEIQKLYIFPGFLKKLDHDLKETFFHVLNFNTFRFNTSIFIRFFREASECIFNVEYSAFGASNIHLYDPLDLVDLYTETILLFRPALLQLSVVAEDGHRGGLSIGKKGLVQCSATDGFPQYIPHLTFSNDITKIKNVPNIIGDSTSMKVIAAQKDHGSKVTCKCGSVSKTVNINVFHHPLSVEVIPAKQYWFKQGSAIQCVNSGGGYPSPKVKWTVAYLNDTTSQYFTITSSNSMSTIHINDITPNLSTWSLNCSSINTIPPLDTGGQFNILNITIGENVASSVRLASYLWIIGVLLVIIIIIVAITFVCASNHFNCRKTSVKVVKTDDQPMRPYLPVDQVEVDGDHVSMTKDQDCFV